MKIVRARRTIAPLTLLLILLIVLPLAPGGRAAGALQQSGTGARLLVDASDGATLAELRRQGATLLVDYGPFSLWRTAGATRGRLGGSGPQPSGDLDTIYLRDGAIDTAAATPPTVPDNLRQRAHGGPTLWLVQFIGPVRDEWLADLAADGLAPVVYMPNNGYVVWGEAAALARAAARPAVNWAGPYHPAYRIAPPLSDVGRTRAGGSVDVTVQLVTTATTDGTLARLRGLAGQVYQEPQSLAGLTDISLALPAGLIETVAGWPDVFNIEPWSAPQPLDEAQGQIIAGNLQGSGPSSAGYLQWLQAKGFPTDPTRYPIVDIVDDGLDAGNASNPLHPDFRQNGSGASRIVAITNCTSSPTGNGVDGHGNLNAGIVGGYNDRTGAPYEDAQGYNYGLGISPYGRIASTKVFNNSGLFDGSRCSNTYSGIVQASAASGATITNNSWGCDRLINQICANAPYDSSSRVYDVLTRDGDQTAAGNQSILHIFSAGNASGPSRTISTPATAKNVITVGASENVRQNGVVDGCGETNADRSDDIATFSSRGPTSDGRSKPDLVAPGTHIQGPASQDPAYTGVGVCGGPNGARYYPSGQTLYTWSSGTSHSAPAVAGAASLIHEYYRRVLRPGQTPSPAMTKALLLNTTRYLTGASANDTLPSQNQGWGSLHLGPLFDNTTSRTLVDQATLLDATGATFGFVGSVRDLTKPLAVTLVWTDAPGSTTGNAYVNNLDLEVTVGGAIYRGNVFSGRWSAAGGSFDGRNNVEQVLLPPGTRGPLSVRVVAANIAGDGVPGNGDPTDQDFALVISNVSNSTTPEPVVAVSGMTLDDSAGNGNGVADPGETVAINLALVNNGDGAATGVNASLSVPAGGTALSGAQSYGDLAGSTSASRSFEVRVGDLQCGASLELSAAASYSGATAQVSATASFPVGVASSGAGLRFDYLGATAAIPDNNNVGVTLQIRVPTSGTLSDLNVRFSATHPRTADLRAILISPKGTTVKLIFNNGGPNGANFSGTVLDDEGSNGFVSTASAPFTGSFVPIDRLSLVDGEQVNGIWKLQVLDTAAGSTGSVTDWGLEVTGDLLCPPANQFSAAAIAPNGALALTPGVTATISGTNFVAGSQVRWTQGVTAELLPTTSVTSTTVTFAIPARLLAAGGTAQVQVVAPQGDGRAAPPLPFVVSKRQQTISLPLLPNKLVGTQPFTITANASSGLPVALTASGACTIAGNTITLKGAGQCTITARQLGDAAYEAAPEVVRSFTVDTALRMLLPVVRK